MAARKTRTTTTRSRKLAKEATTTKTQTTTAKANKTTPVDIAKAIDSGDVSVPGLNGFNLAKAAQHTGELGLTQFQVNDPLNPPDTLPQVTQAQFSRASAIYEKATNAAKLYRSKYRLDSEVFGAVGDRATAINTAISATRTKEQAKANYLNFLSDQEKTKQAAIALDLNLATTSSNQAASTISKEQLATDLELKAVNLERSQTQLDEARGELAVFQSKLGKYLPASK